MKKKFTAVSSLVMINLLLASPMLFGQISDFTQPEIPPVFKAGPFPFGTEEVRNDSPIDFATPTMVTHEYTAYKATPNVDGNIDDAVWKAVPWTLLDYSLDDPAKVEASVWDPAFAPKNWTGWGDFTAWFKVVHDDYNIYLLTMRIDDQYKINEASINDDGMIWSNDAYQMIIDTRAPFDYETESPGAEVGFALVNEDEAFHYWSTDKQFPSVELELADGSCMSNSLSTWGKAIEGTYTETDSGYVETIEMAFCKYGEMDDDMITMFSLIALDRDSIDGQAAKTHSVNQWGQGVYAKDVKKYGSILWSSTDLEYDRTGISTVNNADVKLRNYPNPVTNTTQISYNLREKGLVSLNVYNIAGKHVKTLVNGVQNKGANVVAFDASQLPVGIYMYELKTDSYSAKGKMIRVK